MLVLAQIAFRNLAQAPRRTALLGGAIGLVTMLLILLMSLSKGISDNLVEAATTMSAGHVNVAGFFKPNTGSSTPIVTGRAKVREVVEKSASGVDYVIERHRGWGKIVSDTAAVQAGLSGIVAADESRFFDKVLLAKESEYVEGGRDEVVGDPRKLAEPGTIMLFASQAKRLGVRVGDAVTIKTETFAGQTNTADATVVAVGQDMGLLSSFAVFVPRELLLNLYNLGEDTTGAIWVYLDDIDRAPEVMAEVRKGLADAGYNVRDHEGTPFFFKFEAVQGEDWTGQQIDVTIWRDEVSFLTWVITGFDTVSWFVVSILVLIIAVGIMNSMWNAVRERTKEIGTMRAIGMGRPKVLALFLLEATFLGFFASLGGVVVGALTAMGLDAAHIALPSDAIRAVLMSNTLNLALSPPAMVAAVFFLTLFTGAAAILPALRAATLEPVKALSTSE